MTSGPQSPGGPTCAEAGPTPASAPFSHSEARMSEELKPCPFCGGEPLISVVEAHDHTPMLKALIPDIEPAEETHWVECPGCGCCMAGKNKRADAVTAWNRRAHFEPRS